MKQMKLGFLLGLTKVYYLQKNLRSFSSPGSSACDSFMWTLSAVWPGKDLLQRWQQVGNLVAWTSYEWIFKFSTSCRQNTQLPGVSLCKIQRDLLKNFHKYKFRQSDSVLMPKSKRTAAHILMSTYLTSF
jgi:hypothetical protein